MPTNLEKQIEEERARITALDVKLDANRTLGAKGQLRLALNFLDDTKSALRTTFKGDTSNTDWIAFAADCLQRATQKHLLVRGASLP